MNRLWISLMLFPALFCGGVYIPECVKGRRWRLNNTDYEVFDGTEGLIVVSKCTLPGYFHQRDTDKWTLCVQGRVQQPLPQCRYRGGTEVGKISCGVLPIPRNGNKSCDTTSPIVGSECIFSCENTHYLKGSRKRTCVEEGKWTGNQVFCHVRPACPVPPPLHNGTVIGCSDQNIPRFGSFCEFKCNEGFQLVGSNKLICRFNGKLTDDKGSETHPRCLGNLEDHCTNANCSHYCRYKFGGAECFCQEGYRLHDDRKTCIDINECEENKHHCQQTCLNKPGSYGCSCAVGYEKENRFNCKKIGPRPPLSHFGQVRSRQNLQSRTPLCKLTLNGGCNQICDDSSGIVKCKCEDGYDISVDGKTCKRTAIISTSELQTCAYYNGWCSHNCNDDTGTVQCSCKKGYKLHIDNRACVELQTCAYYNGGCSQNCSDDTGTVQCSCEKGFKLHTDNRTCVDIDECLLDNFNCSFRCENLEGSAQCSCERGFKLIEDGKQCTDIDECADEALNACNQKCHNTNGSYSCSCYAGYVPINDYICEGCRINSYKSSSDTHCIDCPLNSHTDSEGKTSIEDCICNDGFYGNATENEPCNDIDECSDSNFGCSDTCVNTPGSAHCTCPLGFELQEDQKTCNDTNECKIKNGGCQSVCHNSVGSFSCSCFEGYTVSTSDSYACDDIDECQENKGGCSHDCVNFPGGHHCSCPLGSQLGADGKSCHTLRCPAVAVPYYSSLRCAPKDDRTAKTNYNGGEVSTELPVGTLCRLKCDKGYALEESSKTIECQNNGLWNETLDECKVLQCPPLEAPENGSVHPPECKTGLRTVKERCYFTCNEDFMMKGRSVFLCKGKLQWDHNSIPRCLPKYTIPSIICPNDLRVNLMPNESSANITVPSPISNMRHIEVDPDWAKPEETVTFPVGKTNIVFIAKNLHFENMSSSCRMSISVIDKESPSFLHCPSTITISGNNVNGNVSELWVEPEAVDNVGIKSIVTTAELNSNWPPGVHTVEYIAEDLGGNVARCSFEINVTSSECGDLDDPENGEANCMDWVYGKLCEPSCNVNYTRGPNETQFYVCDDSGTWFPSNVVPACLPECGLEEVWSENLLQCVAIASDNAGIDTE